jgi:RNA polymerase sigma factor (TIGR02999 family)
MTLLLDAASRGEPGATDRLFPVVYDELRRMAGGLMSRERADHTLQPTALVHEAYMRLLGGAAEPTWQNRAHFFGAAALAMRRILIDRARHVKATRVPTQGSADGFSIAAPPDTFQGQQTADQLLALEDALVELAAKDKRQHDVVMLRYFAGLTIEQTASALDLSASTVKNEWTYARAWLLRKIERA